MRYDSLTWKAPAFHPEEIVNRKLIRQCLYILLLSLMPFLLIAGEQPVVEASKGEIPGIYNYSFNDDPTGFGGTTEPSAMKALAEQGYKSVINLRVEGETGNDLPSSRMAASQAGLNYVHLPLDTSNPDPAFFENFLAAVNDEANQPAYIHCGSATRVAAMWMSKRVIEDGWSVEKAEQEARSIAGKPDAAVAYGKKFIESQQR